MLSMHYESPFEFRSAVCRCPICFHRDIEIILSFFYDHPLFIGDYFGGNHDLIHRVVDCLLAHQVRLNLHMRGILFMLMSSGGGGNFFDDDSPKAKAPFPDISGTTKVRAADFPQECHYCAEPAFADGKARRFVQPDCGHPSCFECIQKSWQMDCANYDKCPMCREEISRLIELERLEESPKASEDSSAGAPPESPKAPEE